VASCGTADRSAPKQSELNNAPDFVVVETGGGWVVERWWSDRGQGAVAHGDLLTGVDEVDPV
jgi:hypothetical protein